MHCGDPAGFNQNGDRYPAVTVCFGMHTIIPRSERDLDGTFHRRAAVVPDASEDVAVFREDLVIRVPDVIPAAEVQGLVEVRIDNQSPLRTVVTFVPGRTDTIKNDSTVRRSA